MLQRDAEERAKERVTFLEQMAVVLTEHITHVLKEQMTDIFKEHHETTSSSPQQRSKLPDSILMHMSKQTEMSQELLLSSKNLHYKFDLNVGSERLVKVETVLAKLKFKRKSQMKEFFQDDTCKAVLASYILQARVKKCNHCYDQSILPHIFLPFRSTTLKGRQTGQQTSWPA